MTAPSWRFGPTLRRGWVAIALCGNFAAIAGAPRVSTAAPAADVPTVDASFRCTQLPRNGDEVATLETTLAGVPAILRVPRKVTRPPIVLWHGFGAPASERALMEAMPLDDVAAVKVYLGLPLFGSRAPAGGNQELARRQTQDFARLLFKPAVVGAADELPSVVAALEQRGCMTPGQHIGLFGFSAGGTAALVAMMQGKAAVDAAVLLNASTGLDASVDAWQRALVKPYDWTPASRALAKETDAIARAADVAREKTPPAILILQGGGDTVLTTAPAMALHEALLPIYRRDRDEARLGMVVLPGVPHSWIEDKTAAGEVRRDAAEWFVRY